MEFDWTALVNYGALGICLAYFIYKDIKINKGQQETNEAVKDALNGLKEVITVVKELISRKQVL